MGRGRECGQIAEIATPNRALFGGRGAAAAAISNPVSGYPMGNPFFYLTPCLKGAPCSVADVQGWQPRVSVMLCRSKLPGMRGI